VKKGTAFSSFLLCVLGVGVGSLPLTAAERWVLGYYVGYHRSLQLPSQVDYTTMTHIVVGAAKPRNDGSFDTAFDLTPSEGPVWAQETVNRAHAAGIKALLMLGGAGAANIEAFRRVSDPVVRAAFVANLKTLVEDYGFDGFDLDWEPLDTTPGSPGDDRARFLALVTDLRAAMPSVVMTLPVGWDNMNYHPLSSPFYGEIAPYFDRINLMSYSMVWFGAGWQSWHTSALYGETPATPSSVDLSVNTLLANGVPAGKIGVGIGLYGLPYENGSWVNGSFVHSGPPYVTAPHQDTSQATVRLSDNAISNANLLRYLYDAGARHWDATARMPYLSFSEPRLIPVPPAPDWMTPQPRTTFVSYEDEASIAEKGIYVREKGLGGAIVWTISEGYLHWLEVGEKDPFMKAVRQAFLGDLNLTAPNGGEVWRRGESREITWTAEGVEGTLTLELLQGETLLGTVASDLPVAAGRWTWVVGRLADGTWVSGQNLRVRIRSGTRVLAEVALPGSTP